MEDKQQQRPTGRVQRDQTTRVESVRSPKVYAQVCPRNSEHINTRVYSTHGQKRYCICDDCGQTWSQFGPLAGSNGDAGN